MAKWLKDYLNFGNRRDPPQPPRPDYSESDILRAYRAQKDLDFEDPYQCLDRERQNGSGGGNGSVDMSLPPFPAFTPSLSNGTEVKVLSPKHRLIKVDSQEFGHCKIPLSPASVPEEPVLPSAPEAPDTDTDYSDPFDARPDPRTWPSWETESAPKDSCSYMEPFEAQQIISEMQHNKCMSSSGSQLYDNPYEERNRQQARAAPSAPTQQRQQHSHRLDCSLSPVDDRGSRLPQNDDRPADEYDQPWEWKKDDISKALAATFVPDNPPALAGSPRRIRGLALLRTEAHAVGERSRNQGVRRRSRHRGTGLGPPRRGLPDRPERRAPSEDGYLSTIGLESCRCLAFDASLPPALGCIPKQPNSVSSQAP
ncbi:SH2 domain-containing adapter protein D-like isoform X2 [Corythoichthys intestinalis]|uniref:SH2 domain-containing adapter protein D-like isoform X2 n=1 Tax=Corythoichthys intestinalis TaxID=161448 RepID=UPI0025A4E75B|nr:SH2 domain-containing adapter protein D-like isoform X2 [Corythoichthys intestinalis]